MFTTLLLDSDYDFYHAIDDAHQLLYFSGIEKDGRMPWSRDQALIYFKAPVNRPRCFYYSPRDDECFSVSSDDLLTEQDIVNHWPAVEASDRDEIMSFVQHKIFALQRLDHDVDNVVDGVWVRKW